MFGKLPTLCETRLSPQVLIILFGSSSISLSFLFNHMLNVSYVKVWQYALLCNEARVYSCASCV